MTSSRTDQPVILVTGGSGFAGSHLLEALIDAGYTHLHGTSFGSAPMLLPPRVESLVSFHQIDLTDLTATVALFEKIKPDHIYHLASFAAVGKSFEKAAMLLSNNITLQLNVLNAMQQITPTARVLVVGSAEEYGMISGGEKKLIDENFPLQPSNPYGVSKVAQDLLAQSYFLSHNLDVVRARPFNHIGERQTLDFVIPAFASQIVQIEQGKKNVLEVGNLEATRDFTDVKDIARAYIILMNQGNRGDVYNVGSGQGWKIKEVLDILITHAQQPINIEVDPDRLRPSDIPYFVANNHKIGQLGWSPLIPLTETLQRILIEWRTRI